MGSDLSSATTPSTPQAPSPNRSPPSRASGKRFGHSHDHPHERLDVSRVHHLD